MSRAQTGLRLRRTACWGCGALAHMPPRAARGDEPATPVCEGCRATPPSWMVATPAFVAAQREAA